VDCPVTVGTRETWPDGNSIELTYRDGPLFVALYPDGIVQATPDDVWEDGSIAIKFGWWRGGQGDARDRGPTTGCASAAGTGPHSEWLWQ
jgi:hypothetical protein